MEDFASVWPEISLSLPYWYGAGAEQYCYYHDVHYKHEKGRFYQWEFSEWTRVPETTKELVKQGREPYYTYHFLYGGGKHNSNVVNQNLWSTFYNYKYERCSNDTNDPITTKLMKSIAKYFINSPLYKESDEKAWGNISIPAVQSGDLIDLSTFINSNNNFGEGLGANKDTNVRDKELNDAIHRKSSCNKIPWNTNEGQYVNPLFDQN